MPSEVTIITNNVPRTLLSWDELTPEERKEFDYIDPEVDDTIDRFVRYKGWVYDMHEFMYVHQDSPIKGWDGVHNDTFFSGILVKFFGDNLVGDGKVLMGRYYA